MRIFVSGQANDISYVRHIQEELVKAGHVITHDWTRNELGNKRLSSAEAGQRAKLDITGVANCDAYVICTNNEEVGKGMYVELGAALALHEVSGTPKVFLIGNMNHMSIFYLHPNVIRLSNIREVIERLV